MGGPRTADVFTMHASRKSRGKNVGKSDTPKSADSETYLQKSFLKRERCIRIYQPKSVAILSGLADFLEKSDTVAADLEMDNNVTLCAALNALADYGKLLRLTVQSWNAHGDDINDALQRCCENNTGLVHLTVRCRTNPDIIDRVLGIVPPSVKHLDISDNL